MKNPLTNSEPIMKKKFKLKIWIKDDKGEEMWGGYTSEQISYAEKEMKKPKHKRLYVLGIDFSKVNKIMITKY